VVDARTFEKRILKKREIQKTWEAGNVVTRGGDPGRALKGAGRCSDGQGWKKRKGDNTREKKKEVSTRLTFKSGEPEREQIIKGEDRE